MLELKYLQHQINAQGITDASGNQLDEDGIIGPRTLEAIDKCTIMYGAKGEITSWVQDKLISKGYNLGPYNADGVYGSRTYKVILRFQRDNGVKTDGIIGPRTWRALLDVESSFITQLQHLLNLHGFSDDNGNKLDENGILGAKTLAAIDKCSIGYGAAGELIRWIQNRLFRKGYRLGPSGPDAVFGHSTYRAVRKFQADNGLTADGIVGHNTWRKLLNL